MPAGFYQALSPSSSLPECGVWVEGHRLRMTDLGQLDDITPESCIQRCSAEPDCVAVEYWAKYSRCWGASASTTNSLGIMTNREFSMYLLCDADRNTGAYPPSVGAHASALFVQSL